MSNPEQPILLEAVDLHKTYEIEKISIKVLDGVSLKVRKGETVSIMGASGAGKSTLLHMLGGLDRPTLGTVTFRGHDLYKLSSQRRSDFRATSVGFVFQSYHLLPEMNILDNVLLPAMTQKKAWLRESENRKRGLELLARVGLAHRSDHRPLELSGGEQQRVALARALMNEPELVLADEPTGNLDSKTGNQVLEYLFDLVRERKHTLVLVTHNDAVAGLCDRQLRLQDGRLGD